MSLYRGSDAQGGRHLLSIAGIPIYVQTGFFIFLLILFLWQYQPGGNFNYVEFGLLAFVIFFSILFHELGHAVASRVFGCRDISISLIAFGGYTTHSPTTSGKSLIIVLAGPLFGFLLMAAAFAVLGSELTTNEAMAYVAGSLFLINLFWSVFNLFPIYPLDGGQALFYSLSTFLPRRFDANRAMLWVARVSLVGCVVVGALSIMYMRGSIFIPLLCLMLFFDNLRIVRQLS